MTSMSKSFPSIRPLRWSLAILGFLLSLFSGADLFAAPAITVGPNPFTPGLATNFQINWNIPNIQGLSKLKIFDLKGRKILDQVSTGPYGGEWQGLDQDNKPAPSGVYLYLFEVDGFIYRGTVTLIR